MIPQRLSQLPDRAVLDRCLRFPELGPRPLFFTGGSALRRLCRALRNYTHNSIHLVSPFDSGGSSAKLRESFSMLSVGDLRNRLVSLADEGAPGNAAIYALFSHRLDRQATSSTLQTTLSTMIAGHHPLISAVPESVRVILQDQLNRFAKHMPAHFDLQGASIGNLILAGGYLDNGRDMDAVVSTLSALLHVRGVVRPTVDADVHLAATLASGRLLLGQHVLTQKETPSLVEPVARLHLSRNLNSFQPVSVAIDDKARDLIGSADLICYPMGSFYTSVVANLLPTGVGSAICQRRCPKIYVPNFAGDPELIGISISEEVDIICDYVRRDAGPDTSTDDVLHMVLLDPRQELYGREVNLQRLQERGVTVVVQPIAAEDGRSHDAEAVTQILLSLATAY